MQLDAITAELQDFGEVLMRSLHFPSINKLLFVLILQFYLSFLTFQFLFQTLLKLIKISWQYYNFTDFNLSF